jgi:ABC-2 type transport system ATP-binding protein
LEYVVEVKDLTHYYGKKKVYENLNFNIKNGSIFGLLGKNGTGKTTTINILNGFLKPKSGKCLILGENSYKLSPETKSKIGFLIEGHVQYSFMNIIQIEKYYSQFYPQWKRDVYYDLMSKLQVLDNQRISKMSGGQRSQVTLGLLLAQDPDLLILDDYSMGLDAGYRRLFLDFLKEYGKSENKTIFITSHIIQDLEGFMDDCVILDNDGVVLQMPINEFTSQFKMYQFTSDENIKINIDEIVNNFEIIKNKVTIYSFKDSETVLTYLKRKGIPCSNFKNIAIDLEDAFIGITGKY